MAAVTQIRYRHSADRAYYDPKLAEGKTPKETLRSLKRQISDVIFARLHADVRHAAARPRSAGISPVPAAGIPWPGRGCRRGGGCCHPRAPQRPARATAPHPPLGRWLSIAREGTWRKA